MVASINRPYNILETTLGTHQTSQPAGTDAEEGQVRLAEWKTLSNGSIMTLERISKIKGMVAAALVEAIMEMKDSTVGADNAAEEMRPGTEEVLDHPRGVDDHWAKPPQSQFGMD